MSQISHLSTDKLEAVQRAAMASARSIMDFQRRSDEALVRARKKIEKQTNELRQSISLLEATLESSPDGVIAMSLQGEILHMNSKFIDMWSIPDDLAKGKSLKAITHYLTGRVWDPDTLTVPSIKGFANGEFEESEYRLKNGKIFERHITGQYVDGECVGVVISCRDVTTKRIVEQALLRSERLNHAILTSSRHMIVATDIEGTIILFNRMAEECLGYSAEELIGKKSPLIWHDPGELEEYMQTMDGHKENKKYKEIYLEYLLKAGKDQREWTYIRKDNSTFPGLALVTLLRDDRNEVVGFLSEAEDITEQKAMEEQLANAGRILEDSLNEVYIFDAKSLRFIQANRGARENSQYTLNELQSMYPITLTPKSNQKEFDIRVAPLVAGVKEKVIFEQEFRRKDGTFYPAEVSAQLAVYQGRKVYVAFVIDLTARKAAEEKIIQQQNDLKLIFDHVPVRIWFKDDQNKLLRVNKEAADAMGRTVEEVEGKSVYDLYPDVAKKYHETDLSVIASQVPRKNIVEQFESMTGEVGWVSESYVPYTDPLTEKNYIFICNQDISALKNAEMAQEKLINQLRITNDELERYAYIASHDLKSPLHGIEQLSKWISEDCIELLPEKSLRHLDLMSNRIKRMHLLLDDLLAYSRISQIDDTEEEVNLEKILKDLMDLVAHPFGFTYTLELTQREITISRRPLEIVMRNLIANAVKHHDKGNGHIGISYARTDTDHVFSVSDDGPGIDPAMHETIFDMFQTLRPRDEVEGSGMGLAIIKKIVNRYNGSVHVVSDGVHGSTFNINWPIKNRKK